MSELQKILQIIPSSVGPQMSRHMRILGKEISPALFGAIGDGIADDTAAIQLALDYAVANPGSHIRDMSGSTYRLSSTVSAIGSVSVDWGRSTFIGPFTGPMFALSDTPPDGPYALTADYAAGDMSISVSSTGSALAAGTRIRIVSDAVDPANRDTGTAASQYKIAEWAFVGVGSTTTSIVLAAPLRFNIGVSPISTSGDEARVPAYTIAMGARVLVMADRHALSWRGGVLDRGTPDTAKTGQLLSALYYRDPAIEGLRITRGHSAGIAVIGTMQARIVGAHVANLTDNEAAGNFGYGVSDRGFRTLVLYCDFRQCRHGYTTGETTMVSGGSDLSAMCSTGRIVGSVIRDCTATSCTSSSFDTHHGAEDITFIDCLATDGLGHGFAARGRNIRWVRPKVRRCALGVYVFTEYNGSATDPDFYTASKVISDFTSAVIDSPDIECIGAGLTTGASSCEITGSGKFLSRTCARAILNGKLTITGNIRFEQANNLGSALDTTSSAATLTATSSHSAFVENTVHIVDGGMLQIDGRDGTAAPIDLTNGVLQVDGAIAIGVPDGASVFVNYAGLSELSRGTIILREKTDLSTVNVNVSVRIGLRILWDNGDWISYAIPALANSRVKADLPTYADNASAISAGLLTNQMYKTATGELRIVI